MINDIIENKKYLLKFNIEKLKNIQILKSKKNNFVEIENKTLNVTFFLSLFESNFLLEDAKYFGFIFEKNENKISNIGRRLDELKVFTNFYDINHIKKRGILIKYINGDVCRENTIKKYSSYLFITCDKETNKNYPEFIKKFERIIS